MAPVREVPPTTAVADVLALRGRTGWLSPPLRLVVGASAGPAGSTSGGDDDDRQPDAGSPPTRVVADGQSGAVLGRACTVELRRGPGGFGPLYQLLSGDLTARVLVLVAPDDDVAVWGELLSTAAAQVGATGVLVAGAVRDVAACQAVGVPLWASVVRTVGPAGGMETAAIGGPVTVGAVTVADGDLVVLDADGVVALPARPVTGAGPRTDDAGNTAAAEHQVAAARADDADADAILAAARAYADAESQVAAALRAGVPLREAYRIKAEAVAQLARLG
ncbi:MAG: RraA family protein [Acidimicrobiales bacterium]